MRWADYWTHRWHWRKWPTESWGRPGRWKGMPCRVLAVGSRNSALVEFLDGTVHVTSRYGLRREP